ncbi:diacylglycerol kinase family lipid kinase [Alphaproteobacteria bacterium]|nr:diacylglycerol kinase family lipid kinase [Alphaproteobacteria bacterium]
MFTIIVNPSTGSKSKKILLKKVLSELKKYNLEFDLIYSKSKFDAIRIAELAAKDNNIIIACGGDGHVGELANIASKYRVKFGIIPFGSGNDFANQVGIHSYNIKTITSSLLNNNIKLIDLGKINNKLFCSIAGVGLSSEANEWANKKKLFNKNLLYILSFIRTVLFYSPKRIILKVNNNYIEKKIWFIAIANTKSFGKGMMIAPDASYNDGLLDVVIVENTSKWELIKTFPLVFKGNHMHHHAVSTFRTNSIKIENTSTAEPLAVYADGEKVSNLPVNISVCKHSLKLLVPT